MEKEIPGKWKPKISRSSYTSNTENRLYKSKTVRRDKQEHYILIKSSNQQEDKL